VRLALLTTLVLSGPPACSDDGSKPDPPDASVPCTTGTDLDGDHFGPGCPMGEDCDDSLAGIWGPCENGCPTGWARVPEGPFVMGCDPEQQDLCAADSSPAHTVILSEPYCVQLTEVTVGAYRRCVEAGVCPERPETTEEAGDVCNYTAAPGDREQQPANCFGFAAARAFVLLGSRPRKTERLLQVGVLEGARHPHRSGAESARPGNSAPRSEVWNVPGPRGRYTGSNANRRGCRNHASS